LSREALLKKVYPPEIYCPGKLFVSSEVGFIQKKFMVWKFVVQRSLFLQEKFPLSFSFEDSWVVRCFTSLFKKALTSFVGGKSVPRGDGYPIPPMLFVQKS